MGGPTDPPRFLVDGYTQLTQAQFTEQAVLAITEGLEMRMPAANCSLFPSLSASQSWPEPGASAADTVGEMDLPVTRNSEDFKRLVLYQGTNVMFDSASCNGQGCIDCSTGPVDLTLEKRCGARMMSSRMYNVLVLLQKLAREAMGESTKILVLKAWEEGGSTASLHQEGRAMTLRLTSDSTPARLTVLSHLAICARADFVKHEGDHLLIAVQKQDGEMESGTQFPTRRLVRVSPPSSLQHLFQLPSYVSDSSEFPLFDSSSRRNLQIGAYAKLGQFASERSRYLRLDPLIVTCYDKLSDYFAKHFNGPQAGSVEVLRGFLTTAERDELFVTTDPRYFSGVFGMSFEVRAGNMSLADLARLAVKQCTPVFKKADREIGVGLYPDRVYIDIRLSFRFWNPSLQYSSVVRSPEELTTYMKRLFSAAFENRVVDPDFPTEADSLAEPNLRQSLSTDTATPNERSAADAGERPPPRRPTIAFLPARPPSAGCRVSLAPRCWMRFGNRSCEIYEEKQRHCSNFLHWSPFEMAPENETWTLNLFPRERGDIRQYACDQDNGRCIEHEALFLLVVNLVEGTFRPYEGRSVEQDLYPRTENPSPVLDLLHVLYAAYAENVSKVWVHDESDLSAMSTAALMLYNPFVSHVEIYVQQPSSKVAVQSVVANLVEEWRTTGSTQFAREFITSYSIQDFPPATRKKRSVEMHLKRQELIDRVRNWESHPSKWEL
ncbi:LOW QUALITY PROTEIN: uncharacterized protein LOC112561236 [Pomacea canaliculata]|uniref:LOW QUALITY PROTEIN: uncharacterized protein LOC112561236 n=1 Tax=Pomacea canaliculata TaxID=400727 RepID=UPI000D72650A|nr:LOW QUALITY PROTEIN: uncharacterized protein LOC112561236 [Pomacea canaliculata]